MTVSSMATTARNISTRPLDSTVSKFRIGPCRLPAGPAGPAAAAATASSPAAGSLAEDAASAAFARRQDCHFAGIPSQSLLKGGGQNGSLADGYSRLGLLQPADVDQKQQACAAADLTVNHTVHSP